MTGTGATSPEITESLEFSPGQFLEKFFHFPIGPDFQLLSYQLIGIYPVAFDLLPAPTIIYRAVGSPAFSIELREFTGDFYLPNRFNRGIEAFHAGRSKLFFGNFPLNFRPVPQQNEANSSDQGRESENENQQKVYFNF